MPVWLLLAMQASGMVVDYMGTQTQSKLIEMGMQVQQAGIQANIEQTRLETADASLAAMKKLRQTIGSQIAAFAARGTSTAAGSAVSLLTQSQGNFNTDERIRKFNQIARENQLKASGLISRLQGNAETSKLWQGYASRTFNNLYSIGKTIQEGAEKGFSAGAL